MAHQNNMGNINEYADDTISETDVQVGVDNELDIEEPIRKWASYTYQKTSSNSDDEEDNVSEYDEDVVYELKLDKIRIKTGKPSFEQADNPKTENLITQSLFEAVYKNDTDKMQAFSFQVERLTESTARVEMNSSINCGKWSEPLLEMMAIQLPSDVHTAGFGKCLKPTKASHSFTKELKWSVDNLVNVPPKKKTIAALIVSEKEYSASFSVNLYFKGKVFVNVNDRKTGQLIRSLEGDIAEIMRHFGPKMEGLSIKDKKVEFKTEGKCKFVFGVEQNVTLKNEEYKEPSSCRCCIM